MKTSLLKLKIILVIIGLAIFGNAEVWGADWKLYFVHENLLAYYDAQSINHPSKNIIRVWTRWDYKEKGVLGWVGKGGKKYENLSQSIILSEINCIEKKVRDMSVTSYDNRGDIIDSSNSPSEWNFIVPESNGENLYKEVCK